MSGQPIWRVPASGRSLGWCRGKLLTVLCSCLMHTVMALNATGRGILELSALILPPLPPLQQMLASALVHKNAAALELGCGEGNALLELQSQYNRTRGTCINSLQYGVECARRDPKRCAGGVSAGNDSTLALRTAALQLGLPAETHLPRIVYGDFTRHRLFEDPTDVATFDVIYSQHALNAGKINHPATEFLPIVIEVMERLRPCGYALLHLTPCCTDKVTAKLRHPLTYGGNVVWDKTIQAAHKRELATIGTQPQRATILDAVPATLPSSGERVEIIFYRVPAYNSRDSPPMPAAFALLVHKQPRTTGDSCPRGTVDLLDHVASNHTISTKPLAATARLRATPPECSRIRSHKVRSKCVAEADIVLSNTSTVVSSIKGISTSFAVTAEYLAVIHSWLHPPKRVVTQARMVVQARSSAYHSHVNRTKTRQHITDHVASNHTISTKPLSASLRTTPPECSRIGSHKARSKCVAEPNIVLSNTSTVVSSIKGISTTAAHARRHVDVTTRTTALPFKKLCGTPEETSRGPWCKAPWDKILAKRWKITVSRYRGCLKTTYNASAPIKAASNHLMACRYFPQTCDLCFLTCDSRFLHGVLDAASMQDDSRYVLTCLVACAALGAVIAACCAKHADEARPEGTMARWVRTRLPLLRRPASYWSHGRPCSYPSATLKLIVLLLLTVDLSGMTAPELNILASPELIARERSHPITPPDKIKDKIPGITRYLMPDLGIATANAYAESLRRIRRCLFISWGLFLAVPPRWHICMACLYALGAAAYVYLGMVGLTYNLGHSTQSSMLFVTLATFAVPDLGSNKRAGIWLSQMLLRCVIAPVYLCSGMSKIRYIGLSRQVSGAWLIEDPGTFGSLGVYMRGILPSLNDFIFHVPGGLALMGTGNMVLELLMPLALLLSYPSSMVELVCHASLAVMAIGFHMTVFAMMGPNFVRHSMLVLMSTNPLALCGRKDLSATAPGVSEHDDQGQPMLTHVAKGDDVKGEESPIKLFDVLRGVVATAVVSGWLLVQLDSDAIHIRGLIPANKKFDSYWPIPEMSMFAEPSQDASFLMTGVLSMLIFAWFYGQVFCSSRT